MSKFGLTSDQYLWIKKILATYLPESVIYVFGSRSRENHKRYSDLDLAIKAKKAVSKKTLMELQEQFAESSIPFKVELIEVDKLEAAFRESIEEDLKLF